jgi:hypothetical protein
MYGIKIRGVSGSNWLQFFNEIKGYPTGPVTFRDVSEAEIYAQNHEVKNYTIEVINDSTISPKGQQLINE